MILLILCCSYRKLYSLALGGNPFSITVETKNHSNKLLLSITAFPNIIGDGCTLFCFSTIYLKQILHCPQSTPAESLVSQRWPQPTPTLSDLLVWFFGGCQHGPRSPAQESVEVSRYLPYSYSNMIGLLTTGLITPINLLSTCDWSDCEICGLINELAIPALDC